MSKLRGSYYVDGRRSLTLTTSDDDKLMDVGFRLTHEATTEVTRGSLWSTPRFVAGSPGSSNYWAQSKGPVFSIRLCVDWRNDT